MRVHASLHGGHGCRGDTCEASHGANRQPPRSSGCGKDRSDGFQSRMTSSHLQAKAFGKAQEHGRATAASIRLDDGGERAVRLGCELLLGEAFFPSMCTQAGADAAR